MIGVSISKDNIADSGVSIYETPRIEKVSVDLKALLGIIQAEQEQISADGYLFGAQVGSTLEVTQSTPLPPEKMGKENESDRNREVAEKDFMEDRQNFQTELSDSYRQLQMDSKVVGWYYVSWPDPVTSREVVQAQAAFEGRDPNFVLLSYDPWKSASGELAMKAQRLTPEYAEVLKSDQMMKKYQDFINIKKPMFEEIPIEIHVPLLGQLFLYDTNLSKKACFDGNIFFKERENEAYTKRHINSMVYSLDNLQLELADCCGMRHNRRFQRDLRETEVESKKQAHIYCETIKSDALHLDTLVQKASENASLLEALSKNRKNSTTD